MYWRQCIPAYALYAILLSFFIPHTAFAALAVDGTVHSNATTATLTTGAGEVIYAMIAHSDTHAISSISDNSGATATWQKRFSVDDTADGYTLEG
jgi:hypothetical protein